MPDFMKKFLLAFLIIFLVFNQKGQSQGNALHFDGVNDFATFNSTTFGVHYLNRYTIEAWIKTTSAGPIYSTGSYCANSDYGHMFELGITPAGKLMVQHRKSYIGSVIQGYVSNGVVNTGAWTHIAVTLANNGKMSFYINGVLDAVRQDSFTALLDIDRDAPLYIGRNACSILPSSSKFFSGSIDQIKLYYGTLTADNILADMYNTGAGQFVNNDPTTPDFGTGNTPIAVIKFDEGTPSGNNTGITTLSNSAVPDVFNGLTLSNFALTGNTSNFVQSYAMVIPSTTAATNLSPTGFTANWAYTPMGAVGNYFLEVSRYPDFRDFVPGYNGLSVTGTSLNIVTPTVGTYYYRIKISFGADPGTYSNTTTVTTVDNYIAPGNAVNLDGIDDHGLILHHPNYNVSQMTIEAWVRWTPNSSSDVQFITSKGNEFMEIQVGGTANGLRFLPASGVFLDVANALPTNTWTHITCMYNPSLGTARIYINGVNMPFVNNGTNPLTTPIINTTLNLNVGRRASGILHFKGSIDELRVFNTTRTAAQVQSDMLNHLDRQDPTLIGYFNFDVGTANANNTATINKDFSNTFSDVTFYSLGLSGGASNWIESYAMVQPVAIIAGSLRGNSFVARWTAPSVGVVSNYFLDIATDPNFTNFLPNYNGLNVGNVVQYSVTGLNLNTAYYYRVRANKTTGFVANQGSNSRTVIATTSPATLSPPGNAVSFDGIDDAISVPYLAMSKTTIETWALWNPSNSTDIQFIYSRGSENLEIQVGGVANGLRFIPTTGVYLDVANAIPINIWTHITCVYDPANGIAKIYINGSEMDYTNNGPNPITTPLQTAVSATAAIGKRLSGSLFFKGSIDEFRIFNEVRTPVQIGNDLKTTLDDSTPNLLMYFNFDDGLAGGSNTAITSFNDQSASSNPAIMTGFALTGNTSNWTESYARIVPSGLVLSNPSSSGFTATWAAPSLGVINNYLLDISTDRNFSSFVSGFNGLNVGNVNTYTITGLAGGFYYVRIRANKTTTGNVGASSNIATGKIYSYAKPGNALNFDGANDVVTVNNRLGNVGTGNFTFETWVRAVAPGPIFSKRSACAFGNFISLDVRGDGSVLFEIGGTNNADYTPIGTGYYVMDGRWHHVAVTRNANTLTLYADGNLVNTASIAGSPNINNTTPFILGYSPCGYLNGSIDEFKYYNTSLSSAEIQADMANTTISQPLFLQAYYDFDNGTAAGNNAGISTLQDLSPNANTGTLSGFGLSGNTGNWVQSYAMIRPMANNASNIVGNSFVASWVAPTVGSVTNFVLDVSTTPSFTSYVAGYNGLSVVGNSQTVTVPSAGLYYYRVRADIASVAAQIAYSNVIAVTTFNPPGNALSFDGTDDYINVPHHANYNNTKYTIETWVRWLPNANTNLQFITSKGNELMEIHTGGTANALRFIPTPGVYLDVANALPVGVWTHLACMYDPANNFAKIYIDGIDRPFTSNGAALTTAITNNSAAFSIGRRFDNAYFFKGKIDEVRIFNEIRTLAQIQADAFGVISGTTSNLVAYFNFDNGTPGGNNALYNTLNNLNDLSSTQNNGVLNNFALSNNTSNWVQSYAMVIPTATNISNISGLSATLNWTAPTLGTANSYFLDISTDANFGSFVAGYNDLSVAGTSANVTLPATGTYYYRVRAELSAVPNEGKNSNVVSFSVVNTVYTAPGNTLNFDGVNDFVNIANTTSYAMSKVTIETWLHWTPNASTDQQFLYSKAGNNVEIQLGGVANRLRFIPAPNVFLDVANAIPVGIWTHLACVYDPANALAKIYINGQEMAFVNTGTAPLTTPITNNTNPLFLGKRFNDTFYFKGNLDEFRIFNEARTATQIQADMINEIATSTASLVAYFNFDAGTAESNNVSVLNITDRSLTANQGVLNNFAMTGTSSNLVQSYAMLVAQSQPASNATSTSFTANWTAPAVGNVTSYYLDVSTTGDFSSLVAGYNALSVNGVSQNVTLPMAGATFYYRVRANINASVNSTLPNSNTARSTFSYSPPYNALNFDGTDDYVNINHKANYTPSKYTIETWVRWTPNANTNLQFITSKGTESMEIQLGGSANALRFIPTPGVYLDVANAVTVGAWTHLACIYDPTTSFAKIYINGVDTPFVRSGGALSTAINNNTTNINIGRRTTNQFYFKGSIDEFRIFNDVRTASQVLADMQNTIAANTSGLVFYSNADEGTAASNNAGSLGMGDISLGNNAGTLNNFALSGATSNWVASYALTIPMANGATNVVATSFVANWAVPVVGTVSNYLLDVSTVPDFSSFVAGYNNLVVNGTNQAVTLPSAGTYYYRVRAANPTYTGQGAYSRIITVMTNPPANALNFDGVNDAATAPHHNSLNTSKFTIETWVLWNPNSSGDIQFITSKGLGSTEIHTGNNNVRFIPTSGVFLDAGVSLPIGKWAHLVCMYDPATSFAKIYINGVDIPFVNNGSNPLSTAVANNSSPLSIGHRSSSFYFKGSIDELRIFNDIRTAAQVQTDRLATLAAPNTSSLVAYYGFDLGIAAANNTGVNRLADASISANHGILSNFALSGTSSNWLQSYAMVIPTVTNATGINGLNFIANWSAPALGSTTSYLLEVSNNANFSSFVAGYNGLVVTGTSQSLVVPNSGTYYYRVRANLPTLAGQAAYSNTIATTITAASYTASGNTLSFDGVDDFISINNTVGNVGTNNFR
jgi:hypothetical protein